MFEFIYYICIKILFFGRKINYSVLNILMKIVENELFLILFSINVKTITYQE